MYFTCIMGEKKSKFLYYLIWDILKYSWAEIKIIYLSYKTLK